MADIAMCKGQNCPVRESCYRFTAEPNKYAQTYWDGMLDIDHDKPCEMLLDNKGY